MVKYFSKPFFLSVLICLFVFYSGLFSFPERSGYICFFQKEELISISGNLLSSPAKTSTGKFYSSKIQLESAKNQKNYKCSATGIQKVLIPSEMIEAFYPGKLFSSCKSENGHLYDAGGKYFFTGNYNKATGYFVVTDCKKSFWPETITGKIDYFRALCRLQFRRLMFSWGSGGGLLLALLCGAREYTEESAKNAFKNAGLSHILALSGMHLSMFSSIAVFFGKKIGIKKLTFIIRIFVLIIFVWFAGFSPSLLRAFICSMLIIICTLFSIENPDMIMILCFSFLLQIIISPSDMTNAGFLLSYGALFGILLFNNFFQKLYSRLLPAVFSNSLSASTSAQIFTAPLSLKIFGSFCPIGIIATTFISPLITLFIYSGLFFIVLSLIIPGLSRYSGIIVNFQYNLIKSGVSFFALAPRIQI